MLVGSIEIFIADENQAFQLGVNGSQTHLQVNQNYVKTNTDENRRVRRRDVSSPLSSSGTSFLPSRSAYKNKITTFEHYQSGILWIYNVEKRVVIHFDHSQHNLRKKKFYFALRATNRSGQAAKLKVYFRQDLPRIDLLLFFLVLIVILLFILSAFVIGMKLRFDFVQNTRNQIQQIELNAMLSRPLASYPLLFSMPLKLEEQADEKGVINKTENSTLLENRKKTKTTQSRRKATSRQILPLSMQETDDKLAAIVSTVVQLPSNEMSEWNFAIGAGLCLMQNQHLIQVRTSVTNTSHGGRRVETRVHATQIHS